MMPPFNQQTQRLILAAEIAGLLHDLGKLHPGFAWEMLGGGKNLSKTTKESCGISAAHGAILEDGRSYPQPSDLAENADLGSVLKCLKADPAWAAALALPAEWVKQPNTIQANGLGAPLRQHHADGKKFPEDGYSFLGDLYTQGADIRDSALDKGSGGAEQGKQISGNAEIADSFGHPQRAYSTDTLAAAWQKSIVVLLKTLCVPDASKNIVATRHTLLTMLMPIFEQALGETRRPTNDVTLRHHSHSTASFFKAAVAEGALRGGFQHWQKDGGEFDFANMGRVRFRLLGVRWDWPALTRGMLTTTALVSLSERRRDVIQSLRNLIEESIPVGNIIYEDDDGVLILAPGFYEADAVASEALFAKYMLDPLQEAMVGCIKQLGIGTPFRLCWSEPTMYLTDYAEALGMNAKSTRQRRLQADESALRALWDDANAKQETLMQICPQCGLRPAETHEYSLTESSVSKQLLCGECTSLNNHDAKRAKGHRLADDFGFHSSVRTLEDLAGKGDSSRVALISVQVDAGAIASGAALMTQLARPIPLLEAAKKLGIKDANELGDKFERLLDDLDKGKDIDDAEAKMFQQLIGDSYWLGKREKPVQDDGRGKALDVAQGFFLRESAALPDEWKLVRHDGDRLALFALRKHASPARLQRLWDDLRGLWKDMANEVGGILNFRLLPLTLDARGFRFIVSAADADITVATLGRMLAQRLSKVRGGLAAHVSCAVMRQKFPLYIALDVLGRMDARVPYVPHQTWRVESARETATGRHIDWSTPQGIVHWQIDTTTSDPTQADQWHPHVIATTRAGKAVSGPQRLTHVRDLLPGDEALLPPMTFDFVVLEGSARRHQLTYRRRGEELRRPHWVMGEAGRSPLLLENFTEFSSLVKDTGWESSKIKGLMGEMVETYEKWVGDSVPIALRETGRSAWHAHLRNMLLRYIKGDNAPVLRDRLFNAIIDGRFFDAVEWTTFVSKTSRSLCEENA